ncbi:uncharacterized protein LOC112528161 isoform X5 [Cynara cardunculus var. scolymus]|uniref:uncharacterized protein LOC112528161 isoform X5 n=1 Tax=Cynara cardunculus var. scolymus TaxID=59895 RepID=UPI000D625014|nr:uncharacterized protein LOC112528161 isoform X5 [Cynara cardunculus var. scolymus]
MTTESSEEGPPSFFKVVRCPSAPHLALPTAFVKRYLEKIPKTPILKTATGESSWRLKIKKIGEDYCFSDGWEKLAKDAQLRIMDIVVVSLIDPFTFEVAFFDANGCDKDLPLNNTKFSGDADDVDEVMSDEEDDGDEVMPNENLCFQKVISEKSHRYTMTLPQKFVKAAELENRSGIRMKDHEGKEWIMGLLVEKYHNRHSLSSAQVLKNKKAGKQENGNRKETPANMEGVKRKRGRPRVEKPGNGNGGGVKVKSEDEAEVIKRKRGRPPLQKHRDGGVKIENQSEVVKRKRGRPRVEGKIKIEDGDGDGDGDCDCDGDGSVVKIKVEKGGFSGVEVKTETETEVAAVKRKRGRPPLDRSKQRVIYF